MSIDIFPSVYVEKRVSGRWLPFDLTERCTSESPCRLPVLQSLSPRAYVALFDACDAACPNGAVFSDVHEREFARFAAAARARAEQHATPLDEDYLFGAGALTLARLRALARGPAPESLSADPVGHAIWNEACTELLRWASVVKAAGGGRIVYWFDVD